jgi:hypothetical protein
MAEITTATPEAPKVEVPKQVCEKCRNSFPLDQFTKAIPGQECVCTRCLKVMGYQV